MCIFFIHSFVSGHVGCFHVRAVVHSAGQWSLGCVYLFKYGFLCIYASGITGSYSNYIFSFLRYLCTVFTVDASTHSHQQCRSVPFSPPTGWKSQLCPRMDLEKKMSLRDGRLRRYPVWCLPSFILEHTRDTLKCVLVSFCGPARSRGLTHHLVGGNKTVCPSPLSSWRCHLISPSEDLGRGSLLWHPSLFADIIVWLPPEDGIMVDFSVRVITGFAISTT